MSETKKVEIMQKKILKAADILGAEDVKTVEIDIPEWGGTVLLRNLSAADSVKFYEENQAEGENKRHGAVRLAAACLVDEEGNRLFTLDDVEKLAKKSLSALMRIQRVALELNGMRGTKETEAKND